jgi:hypothetical protein
LAAQDAYLESLSEEDRLALMRGEGTLPSERRRRRCSRVVRGASQEAHGVFTLLERSGGERSVKSLVERTHIGDFVQAGITELVDLGLAEVVGAGADARVRLLPAAKGVALDATWSMR